MLQKWFKRDDRVQLTRDNRGSRYPATVVHATRCKPTANAPWWRCARLPIAPPLTLPIGHLAPSRLSSDSAHGIGVTPPTVTLSIAHRALNRINSDGARSIGVTAVESPPSSRPGSRDRNGIVQDVFNIFTFEEKERWSNSGYVQNYDLKKNIFHVI